MDHFGTDDKVSASPIATQDGIPFDPLRDLLVTQAARPAHVSQLNFRTLTPFQRALMVIDGTVTKFIEAYTMEPVEIVRLNQEQRHLQADHPLLQAPRETAVLARQALLRGEYSHRIYAYAASLIVPERLGDIERQALEQEGEGLGRILLKSQLETRREVLWYGREQDRTVLGALAHLDESEFICRAYRVIAGGLPIMLINEKFPVGIDRLPAHH